MMSGKELPSRDFVMHVNDASGQRVQGRWRRVFGGAASLIALMVIPALGVAYFGSDILSSFQGDAPAVAAAPLTFDAPTVALNRVKAQEGSNGVDAVKNVLADSSLLLDDFSFTQASTRQQYDANTSTLFVLFLLFNNTLIQQGIDQATLLSLIIIELNLIHIRNVAIAPTIPPASP